MSPLSKAAGPDGISFKVLRTCGTQLCHLFNLSLSQEKVHTLWRTSCLVPVTKKLIPSDPKDYWPIALTCHLMLVKVLERLVLAFLRKQVRSSVEPLQFAYQSHLGAKNSVIDQLQRAHSELDEAGRTVRITFLDFSCTVNTMQPLLVSKNLQMMMVDSHGLLDYWLPDIQAAVCPCWCCSVSCGRELSGGTTEDCAFSILGYPLHLRLSVQLNEFGQVLWLSLQRSGV